MGYIIKWVIIYSINEIENKISGKNEICIKAKFVGGEKAGGVKLIKKISILMKKLKNVGTNFVTHQTGQKVKK